MSKPSGPPAWENWKTFDAQDGAIEDAVEYILYSDSRWIGEISEGAGPYRVLNTIGGSQPPAIGHAQPVLALRVDQALDRPPFPNDPSEHVRGTFHGGWIDEEIAALLSLIFSVRCRSGGMWRVFDDGKDPRGSPFTFHLQPPLLARPAGGLPQLPPLPREVRYEGAAKWLNAYRHLPPKRAVVLARAARAFQLGIWSADDDPDLAWLRLISSLEAASKDWLRRSDETDMAVLNRAWPELAALVDQTREELRDPIARLVSEQVKVKSAVIQFVDHFAPDPPAERSEHEYERLDWEQMSVHVAAIYNRRSETLHRAIPLPRSMTVPPRRLPNDPPPAEASFSMGWHDSNWPQETAPMPLWTFTYIVAGALRNWWRALAKDESL